MEARTVERVREGRRRGGIHSLREGREVRTRKQMRGERDAELGGRVTCRACWANKERQGAVIVLGRVECLFEPRSVLKASGG